MATRAVAAQCVIDDTYIGGEATDYGDLFIGIDGLDSTNYDTYYTTDTTWKYVFDTSLGNIYSVSEDGVDDEPIEATGSFDDSGLDTLV